MSRVRSFLGQVTRYTGGGERQEENTLTEAFAATLGAAQPAAARIARVLASADPDTYSASLGEKVGEAVDATAFLAQLEGGAEVKASTQWAIPTVGIPDLVLSVSDGITTRRIAVEVKIDADLTGDQLRRYVDHGHFDLVVLLAPRRRLRELGGKLDKEGGGYRNHLALRAWETVGRVLRGAETRDPVQQWIVDQFIDYLREVGLMAPEGLDEKYLEALAWADPARDAIVELLHQVKNANELHEWSPGENTNIKEQRGVGSYIHWLLPEWRRRAFPEGAEPWLQLSVVSATRQSPNALPAVVYEDPPQEGLFFTAGLCTADAALMDDFVETMDAERDGLDTFDEGRGYRLGRKERAASLLEGNATLEDQATAVAKWVRESFELVAPLQPAK